MIRIGVSGPGGTGKTTLAMRLSSEFGLPLVAEGVREWLLAERAAGPWRLTAEDQLRLQRHAVSYKMSQERLAGSFVSDRTTVDAATLITLRFCLLGHAIPDALRAEALAHATHSYDVAVLLTQQLAPDLCDEERIDPALRVRERELTRALYDSIGIPVIDVPPMNAAEIAGFVVDALRPFIEGKP